jgi:hypothetical protein
MLKLGMESRLYSFLCYDESIFIVDPGCILKFLFVGEISKRLGGAITEFFLVFVKILW